MQVSSIQFLAYLKLESLVAITNHLKTRAAASFHTARLRGIKLGDFGFSAEGLQLGQLRGNCFRLLVRDVRGAT
jgi:tRNA(Glu) U13 pseudouridine synthase TruD